MSPYKLIKCSYSYFECVVFSCDVQTIAWPLQLTFFLSFFHDLRRGFEACACPRRMHGHRERVCTES